MPPNRADDLVDNAHQVTIVSEDDAGFFKHARALNVNLFGAVHQYVADGRILKQRLEWPHAKDLIHDLERKPLFIWRRQVRNARRRRLQIRHQLVNYRVQLATGVVVRLRREFLKVDVVQQFAMDSESSDFDRRGSQGQLFSSPRLRPTDS